MTEQAELTDAAKSARRELKRRIDEEPIRYDVIKPYQRPFVFSPKQIDSVLGGNRSGKTFTGANRFVRIVLGEEGVELYGLQRLPIEYPKPPYTAWVVSVDFTTSRDVAQPALLRALPKSAIAENGIKYRERSAIDYILLKSGIRIIFKSCDSGWRKFQGSEVPVMWFDEEPDEDVYKECMMRVGTQKRYVIITMTPLSGTTWLVDRLAEEASDKNSEYDLHQFYTADNDSLAPGELDAIRKNYPEDEWITRSTGVPLEKSGLIYPEFRYDIHTYPDIYNFGELFDQMAWYHFVDYGRDLPFAAYLVGVDSRGTFYFHKEHYLAGFDLEVHAAATKEHLEYIPSQEGHEYNFMYADPSIFDGEKKNRQSIATRFAACLSDIGFETAILKGNNDVDLGIETVKMALKVSDENFDVFSGKMGAPRLFINRECRKLIWEIRRYRRHQTHKINYEADKPRKVDDHGMDAMRYGIVRLSGYHGGKVNREHRERRRHPYLG